MKLVSQNQVPELNSSWKILVIWYKISLLINIQQKPHHIWKTDLYAYCIHSFFYKKLSSETSTQFLSVLSTQFLSGFLSGRDLRNFYTKTRTFSENHTSVSYAFRIWVLGFLILKKFEYWFLINGFLIEKNVYSDQHCVCAQDVNSRWLWTNLFIFRHDKLSY